MGGVASSYKLSIVMPVYNVEEYIIAALDSIERQTNQKFELIIVNDGSTDRSSQLINTWINEHKFDFTIHIINQENAGLSAARNVGINQSTSEYIFFMDSDDEINQNLVDTILKVADVGGDVIRIMANTIDENGDIIKKEKRYQYRNFQLLKIDDILRNTEMMYYPAVWQFAFKRDLLVRNNIYFLPGILYEDKLFTPTVLLYAKTVIYCDTVLYYYRVRQNSIMTGNNKQQKVLNSWKQVVLGLDNLLQIATNQSFSMEKQDALRKLEMNALYIFGEVATFKEFCRLNQQVSQPLNIIQIGKLILRNFLKR